MKESSRIGEGPEAKKWYIERFDLKYMTGYVMSGSRWSCSMKLYTFSASSSFMFLCTNERHLYTFNIRVKVYFNIPERLPPPPYKLL